MAAPTIRLRKDVVNALRGGAVPSKGLHLYATGLERFVAVVDEELADVGAGQSKVKAVRAEYGGGKTFFSRWIQARALDRGFAVAEVQISAADTPLHQFETVYRRAMERLATAEKERAAFRDVVDGWLYTIEEELTAGGKLRRGAPTGEVGRVVAQALDGRLRDLSAENPHFAAVLRAYHQARLVNDDATAEGLIAWLSGEPGIGAAIKRHAQVTGAVDARMALNFLHGVVTVLRATARKGLLLVLDEVETIQRQRSDVRKKSLEGLQKLIDELLGNKIPGVYLVVTGTEAFFTGPLGVASCPPLQTRLEVHFSDHLPDNPRDIQVRLLPFDRERLVEVGRSVRDLYPARKDVDLSQRVGEPVLKALAANVLGCLGGKIGVAPRLYLKKLVGLLDRVNDNADFDPTKGFQLEIQDSELTDEERALTGRGVRSPDDVKLELDDDA